MTWGSKASDKGGQRFGFILKVEPIGFPNLLDEGFEREESRRIISRVVT